MEAMVTIVQLKRYLPVQSRHESESVKGESFESKHKTPSDRVRMAQLDRDRLKTRVAAKQMFLAISSSVFAFENPNNRRLWWRAQQGR